MPYNHTTDYNFNDIILFIIYLYRFSDGHLCPLKSNEILPFLETIPFLT